MLNNEYSYHIHCNKVLKLKESRIKNRTLDFTIKEECCSAPKQKFTCLKILIKNAFRIATHTLLTVKVRFDHGLDSRAATDLV